MYRFSSLAALVSIVPCRGGRAEGATPAKPGLFQAGLRQSKGGCYEYEHGELDNRFEWSLSRVYL